MTNRNADRPLPGAPDPWAPSELPRFRARPPYLMTEMIAAEPALAERLVHRLGDDAALEQLADRLRRAADEGKAIITLGCGTSEHAAMGLARFVNEALDLPPGRDARAMAALEVAQRPPRDGVVIAVSHEGGTRITNDALRVAGQGGVTTALVTVSDRSPGAELADLVIATGEQDQSWCHTVGYLSPLVVGVALSARITGSRLDAAAIRALLDVGHDPHAAASVAASLAGIDRVIVAGTGGDQVTARELALKVAEGARLPADAHDLETVLHGHLAAATRWTGLLVVMTDADTGALVRERATRVLEAAKALGVPAAAILADSITSDVPDELAPAGRIVLPHTGRVRGVAGSLLASAMALHVLTERLARARGVNPDTLGREDPAQAAAHA
jgi:glutamine---fructose-6-phosphate transaminase (isomerizing)